MFNLLETMLSFLSMQNFIIFLTFFDMNIFFSSPFFLNLETVSSSISKDAEALNTKLGLNSNLPKEQKATLSERQPSWRELLQQPALKDSNLNLEEFEETILKTQSEVEDDSLSELKNLGLDKHSRKKRMIQLSHKCCYWGCTRKELARQC